MTYRYAQLSSGSVCVAISDLSGEVDAPNMVLLADEAPETVIGHRYENGQWIEVPQEPQPAQIEDISDRQFFQALAYRGEITEAEALDAVGPGIIPPAMDALIDQLPQEQRFPARMLIRGATRYERQHPIADLIRGLYGWTSEQADDFWRFAATL
ncbi:hypothetical protein P7F60_11980 [Rhizobium sp. YJ-22]|uniref:hypothetical protein n=1 Tax=Rhizobium sp. YJ-22 TaxID=3037556 RepID=UPI0024127DA1|nr:hypothetical protein [Rhizobium sp. YJ-22]MDG3577111.1 hypothetical protein [Rhizobium sp. YJ-22]